MIRSNSIRAVALGLAMAGMLPVASSAQVTLTVVMKSGQRYTGRNLWYRLDRREVVLRTSQSEEPRLPFDQVRLRRFRRQFGCRSSAQRIAGSRRAEKRLSPERAGGRARTHEPSGRILAYLVGVFPHRRW